MGQSEMSVGAQWNKNFRHIWLTAFADVAGLQIDLNFFVARSSRVEVFVGNVDHARLASGALEVCQGQNVGRTTEKSKSVFHTPTDMHTPVFGEEHYHHLHTRILRSHTAHPQGRF